MKKFLFIILAVAFSYTAAQNFKIEPGFVKPSAIDWEKAEKLSNGVQNYLLVGDPAKEGYYIMMVKIPVETKLPPHFHPENRTVAVLSGKFLYGYGDTFDESKMNDMTTGTYFTEPANQPHFAYTKESDVILLVNGFGPTGTTIIKK